MSDYWGNEAAGVILFDPEAKKFGLARRSSLVNEPGTLGTFGGAIENGDSIQETVDNELMEEIGYFFPAELEPLAIFEDSDQSFRYHNFVARIDFSEFEPTLNWENDAIEWYTIPELQKIDKEELHFGLSWLLEQKGTLSSLKGAIRQGYPEQDQGPGLPH